MRQFNIQSPSKEIRPQIQDKIDNLTKPKGSLGMLEELALRICLMQQTLSPELRHPHNVLFAADHGIIEEGVSVSPKEVTWQQLLHFSHGGAGINFLCNQHGFKLVLVDAGVDFDIPKDRGILDRKVRRSTHNFLNGPAMTLEEWNQCIESGAEIVRDIHQDGCNVISFGEMGSGNTSSSSMWMHLFTGIPLDKCIGAGAGLDKCGVSHKYQVLKKALENFQLTHPEFNPNDNYKDKDKENAKAKGLSPEEVVETLAYFGGYEMAMAVGAMLQAAELRMIILVDGFIMTSCMLAASTLYPQVLDYAIFGHQGDESGHKWMLEYMNAKPLLHLGLRLGEGSGSVCAYPIVVSAVNMINEMDSFEKVKVYKYF